VEGKADENPDGQLAGIQIGGAKEREQQSDHQTTRDDAKDTREEFSDHTWVLHKVSSLSGDSSFYLRHRCGDAQFGTAQTARGYCSRPEKKNSVGAR
jgi:AraC-like DNA-binding protein